VKMKRICCVLAALMMTLVILPVTCGFAVGVSVSGGGTVNVGDTFNVSVSFSGANIMGVDARLSYDSSVVAFQSGGGASGSGIVLYSDGTGNSLGTTLTFKAVAPGSSSISVSVLECYDVNLASLGGGSSSTKVTVNAAAPDSTQAPQQTSQPVVTKQPAATQKPSATKKPAETKKPGNTVKPTATPKPTPTPSPTPTPVPVKDREVKMNYGSAELYAWHMIPEEAEIPEGFEKQEVSVGAEKLEALVDAQGTTLLYRTDAQGEGAVMMLWHKEQLTPYEKFGTQSQRTLTLLLLPEEVPEGYQASRLNLDDDSSWQALQHPDQKGMYLLYAIGPDGQEGWFTYDEVLESLTRYAPVQVQQAAEPTPAPTAAPEPTQMPVEEPLALEPHTDPVPWYLFALTLAGLIVSWVWFFFKDKILKLLMKK